MDQSFAKALNIESLGVQCDDGYASTSSVGALKANGFGINDMFGNVKEWTQDCYYLDAQKASQDKIKDTCLRAMLGKSKAFSVAVSFSGGSWSSSGDPTASVPGGQQIAVSLDAGKIARYNSVNGTEIFDGTKGRAGLMVSCIKYYRKDELNLLHMDGVQFDVGFRLAESM